MELVRALEEETSLCPQHQPLSAEQTRSTSPSLANKKHAVLGKAKIPVLNRPLVTFSKVCTSAQKSSQDLTPD